MCRPGLFTVSEWEWDAPQGDRYLNLLAIAQEGEGHALTGLRLLHQGLQVPYPVLPRSLPGRP